VTEIVDTLGLDDDLIAVAAALAAALHPEAGRPPRPGSRF
jgi:hypothetical protein